MTTSSLKPTTRETLAIVRDRGSRPLIVTVVGSCILLRPKGLRRAEVLELGAAWSWAVRQRVAAEKAERRKAKGRR